MARSKRNINVGASVRKSDIQAIANVAAAADDAALEALFTPGSTLKTIEPLTEESATVNPSLLVVGKDTDGTLANGKVRMRPALLKAASDAFSIAMSAKQAAALDSPTIGNNAGGTRTDLLYATISYGTPTTESVRKKPLAGGQPISTPLTTKYEPLVTLGIVAGVTVGFEILSLPVDDTVNGVYNFALAALTVAGGYAGGAFNQASIAPLWHGGRVRPQRMRGIRAASFFSSGLPEMPNNHMSDRFGGDHRVLAYLKFLATTGASIGTGVTIDTSIDWRNRFVWGWLAYLGSALGLPLEGAAGAVKPLAKDFFCGFTGGSGGGSFATLSYNAGASVFSLGQNAVHPGALQGFRDTTGGASAPIDGANGDLLSVVIFASDQLPTT